MKTVAGIHVVHPYPEQARQKLDEGYRFIAYGIDFLFLKNKAREGIRIIRDSASPQ